MEYNAFGREITAISTRGKAFVTKLPMKRGKNHRIESCAMKKPLTVCMGQHLPLTHGPNGGGVAGARRRAVATPDPYYGNAVGFSLDLCEAGGRGLIQKFGLTQPLA